MHKRHKNIIVCNSSPIINLCNVGLLSLFKSLYGQVIIPNAVFKELTVKGSGHKHDGLIRSFVDAKILRLKTPHNAELIALLGKDLDEGESEVIALALELKADVVLIDEMDARDVAGSYNLHITGFIGMLLKAQRLKIIPSALPYLEKARNAGFWINEGFFAQIKEQIKELGK